MSSRRCEPIGVGLGPRVFNTGSGATPGTTKADLIGVLTARRYEVRDVADCQVEGMPERRGRRTRAPSTSP